MEWVIIILVSQNKLFSPEINYDKIDQIRGMNITMVTSGQTDHEAYELLLSLGVPIKKKKELTDKD